MHKVQLRPPRVFCLLLASSRLCVIFVACCFLTACTGGSAKPRYKVTGKVTYQSQPVEEGEITFQDPSTGEVNSSQLSQGGAYTVDLPEGSYKVSVSPPLIDVKPTSDTPPGKIEKKVNNIPKKYWVQESSDLTAEVAKDKRTADFDLKP